MTAVSYMPLARKYRPKTFAELCGQGATATALANAIKLGREPHAVIFSGVRGVGKTTSARLYAKALNCSNPKLSEPCNACDSCEAISNGIHEDVMEIDGASNTSVDDVRALRETVSYVPQRSRFKVYIIDEVHMLSQSAFNALLKTLEEPPAHVVFVFATTELQKIPQTIMSRCQVYHLQKLSLNAIRERILQILKEEVIDFEEKAVLAIAREGHGSMRDALTLLDHVIAVGGGKVSVSALERVISYVSSTQFINLLDALVSRNPSTVIESLDQFEDSGVTMTDVAEKTATMARHSFIVRDVGTESVDFKSLGMDDDEVRHLNEIALRAGPADLNRIFRTLAKARLDLDGSEMDRYILENYALEWCLDPGIFLSQMTLIPQKTDPTSSSQRPNSSNFVSSTTTTPAAAKLTMAEIRGSLGSKPQTPPLPSQKTDVSTTLTQAPNNQATDSKLVSVVDQHLHQKALPASWRECVEEWKRHRPLQAKKLEDAHPVTYSNKLIELVIPADSFLSATLLKADEQKKLRDAFAEMFDYKGPIVFKAKNTDQKNTSSAVAPLPENLATIQQRENLAKREKVTFDAQNNPITQDAMRLFNATIETVEINSDT